MLFSRNTVVFLQAPTSLSQVTQLMPNKMEAVDILRVIGTWVDLESIILKPSDNPAIVVNCRLLFFSHQPAPPKGILKWYKSQLLVQICLIEVHVNVLACVCTCTVYFSVQQNTIYRSWGRGYCQYTLCKFKAGNLIQRGQTLTRFSGIQIFFTVVSWRWS